MTTRPTPTRPPLNRCEHLNGCGHHTTPSGLAVWHMGVPGTGQDSMRAAAQDAANQTMKAQVLRWRPREDRPDELIGPSVAAVAESGGF